jgi:TP901 family phage tail tape measure protein
MPITLADAVVRLSADATQLNKDLSKAETQTTSFFKSFGSKANLLMAGAIAGGAAAATGALIQVGKTAVNVAFEMDNLERSFEQTLGVTTERAQQLGDIVQDVYVRGLGDSLTQVGEAVEAVNLGLGDLGIDDTGIEQITGDVLLLSDAFGVDLNEAVRTTSILMKTGLAKDSQEALDIMTAGFQNGLNVSDDLLDTLNEYSEDFARMGLTADETLGILNAGLDAGVLNTDKIADAMNEFGIRVKEADIVENIGEINTEMSELLASFQRGDISEFDLFTTAISLLEEIEDPIERNTIGVMLFGSMWEDLGADAILALNDVDESLIKTNGATKELGESVGTSLPERFERLKRRATIALEPFGERLITLAETQIPHLESALGGLIQVIDNLGLAWGVALDIGEFALDTLAKKAAKAVFGMEEKETQFRVDEDGWFFDESAGFWGNVNAPGSLFTTKGGPPLSVPSAGATLGAVDSSTGQAFGATAPPAGFVGGIGGFAGSAPTAQTPTVFAGQNPNLRDNGGEFGAFEPFGVGKDMPFEIIVPNQAGNAITPDQLAEAMQGGGTRIDTVNITVMAGEDGEETARNLIAGLRSKGIQVGGNA